MIRSSSALSASICACSPAISFDACACQKAKRAEADKQRPSARKRGYDSAWQKAAAAFLREPGHERCACGAPATVVMHTISIRERPDLKMFRSNWKPGCVRCNAIQADRERRQPGGGSKLSPTGLGPARGLDSAVDFISSQKFRGRS